MSISFISIKSILALQSLIRSMLPIPSEVEKKHTQHQGQKETKTCLVLSCICDQRLLLMLFKCQIDSVWLLSLRPTLSTVISSRTSERMFSSTPPRHVNATNIRTHRLTHTCMCRHKHTKHVQPSAKSRKDTRIWGLIASFSKQCLLFQHVFQAELWMWHANLSEDPLWEHKEKQDKVSSS